MIDYDLMEERLKDDYKEVFQKAKLYGVVRNIDTDVLDEMLMNLFDLLLTAQAKEKPVLSVIGSDVEKFCEEYFQDYDVKERVRHLPKYINGLMKLILFFEIIQLFFIEEEGVTVFQSTSNLFPYMCGLIGGQIGIWLIDILIKPIIFRSKRVKVKSYHIGIVVIIVIVLISSTFFADRYEVNVPQYITILISFLYITIYSVTKYVKRYKKYGTLRKRKEIRSDFEIASIKDLTKQSLQSLEVSMQKELVKRYEKKNKRLVKRGKQEMTPEQFMEILRKENKKTKKLWKRMRYFYAAIVIVLVVVNYFMDKSGVADLLIFAGILTVIEIFVYKMCKSAAFSGIKAKEKILDECERLGINIVEYVQDDKNESK